MHPPHEHYDYSPVDCHPKEKERSELWFLEMDAEPLTYAHKQPDGIPRKKKPGWIYVIKLTE